MFDSQGLKQRRCTKTGAPEGEGVGGVRSTLACFRALAGTTHTFLLCAKWG